jgi:hypothetical protein
MNRVDKNELPSPRRKCYYVRCWNLVELDSVQEVCKQKSKLKIQGMIAPFLGAQADMVRTWSPGRSYIPAKMHDPLTTTHLGCYVLSSMTGVLVPGRDDLEEASRREVAAKTSRAPIDTRVRQPYQKSPRSTQRETACSVCMYD